MVSGKAMQDEAPGMKKVSDKDYPVRIFDEGV